MTEIALWLGNNWLAIIFFIATIVLTLALVSRKVLKYEVYTEELTLAKPSIENLKISYNGVDVKKLYKAKINISNSGNKTIDGKNVSKVDPIRLKFRGKSKLLDYQLKTNKVANNVKEILSNSEMFFEFDYLDRKDNFDIEMMIADECDLEFVGCIKECKIIRRKSRNDELSKIIKSILYFFTGILSVFAILAAINPEFFDVNYFVIAVVIVVLILMILDMILSAINAIKKIIRWIRNSIIIIREEMSKDK